MRSLDRFGCVTAAFSASLLLHPEHAIATDWSADIRAALENENASPWDYFGLGLKLAEEPGGEACDALRSIWPTVQNPAFKQQIIKAWHLAEPAPYRVRLHPLAFDLYLAALDANDPPVTDQILSYLPSYAWRTFGDAGQARQWLEQHRDIAPEAATLACMGRWLAQLRESSDPAPLMNHLAEFGYPLRRNETLIVAGRAMAMTDTIEKALQHRDVTMDATSYAYFLLTELAPARYPSDGFAAFAERFKDRAAAQRRAERARLLREYQVRKLDDDDRKLWILHPPLVQQPPASGWGLLLVLPGGDGSVSFAPFVAETIRAAAGKDYAVVQMIAPPLPEGDENSVVWPRSRLPDSRVDFTMEPLIRAAVEQVKQERTIDPNRVWVMGWSSGGTIAYAVALEPELPFRGALVAMSVFKPEHLPPLEHARDKSFYILHSPQDFIAMSFPQAAVEQLGAHGAQVKLQTYEGGHGWHGDIDAEIRRAIEWLDQVRQAR
ncbi:MAG TPA: prolyl oligopeptidase family serine peptidase [Phycisphaerae bacterium]|jgi:poly(3-hydroxybutyrate) depolymerase